MDTQFSPQSDKNIGILSPGKMGVTLAYSLKRSGHNLFWVSDGRSDETRARADEFGLVDVNNVKNLVDRCDFIFCIGDGGVALDFANFIAESKYQGIYVDANGLWGEESEKEIFNIVTSSGVRYVEAGLYGWPYPGKEGYTDEHTIYLSGSNASSVADLFTDGYWTPEIHQNSAKEVKRLRNDRERGTEFRDPA